MTDALLTEKRVLVDAKRSKFLPAGLRIYGDFNRKKRLPVATGKITRLNPLVTFTELVTLVQVPVTRFVFC